MTIAMTSDVFFRPQAADAAPLFQARARIEPQAEPAQVQTKTRIDAIDLRTNPQVLRRKAQAGA